MKEFKNIYNISNLPVPEVTETKDLFLKWIKPLVTKEQYKDAEIKFNDFVKSDVSKKLQDVILEKAKNKDNSWLYDWWLKYAYLISRGPVTTECNAPITFKFSNANKYNQLQKMAVLYFATAETYLYTETQGVPDFKVKGHSMSLDQMYTAFASIRNPGVGVDEFYQADGIQTHSIFQYKNRLYKITVIEDGKVVSVGKIYKALNDIVNSNVELLEVSIGHITSFTNRDKMAGFYSELMENKTNQDSYKVVADAIILASYDEENYGNVVDTLKSFVIGKEFNRFHGKTLAYIITENEFGIIADHTPIDGGTELWITNTVEEKFANQIEVNEDVNGTSVEELKFEFNDSQKVVLKELLENFKKYIGNLSLKIQKLDVRRAQLRETGIVSADAFIHLAFQLAQLDAWGKIRNTYIAVDVRNFYKGRTECLRPVSEESIKAVNALREGNSSKEELKVLIMDVMNEHYSRLKACQAGRGLNRHMLGLQLAWEENQGLGEKPKIFDTDAWEIISANPISTSSIVSPITGNAFFEPVHPEGIGLAYVIDDRSSYISVTAYQNNVEARDKFVESVVKWTKTIEEVFK